MQRFKNILCYVGGPADPKPGLDRAVELAARNEGKLTIIDVLPESTEGPWLTVSGQSDLEEMVVASRVQDLEEMVAPIQDQGIEVALGVNTGSPFVEIIRRVEHNGHDLVIKTAQGLESRLGGLLGTTALHLMRKCPCPVWVVKPMTGKPFDRVLAAVDPDPQREGADELSRKIVELGASLARASGSTLHVVHAWWLYSEAMLRGRRINITPARIDGLLREVRGAAEETLDRLLASLDLSGVSHEVHLIKGLPYDVVGGFAAQSDVAVMGTLSRSGVEGLLIGNTAERVLRRVDCSVLAVKPEGFKTPLKV